jgi:hypothetical protein
MRPMLVTMAAVPPKLIQAGLIAAMICSERF